MPKPIVSSTLKNYNLGKQKNNLTPKDSDRLPSNVEKSCIPKTKLIKKEIENPITIDLINEIMQHSCSDI